MQPTVAIFPISRIRIDEIWSEVFYLEQKGAHRHSNKINLMEICFFNSVRGDIDRGRSNVILHSQMCFN